MQRSKSLRGAVTAKYRVEIDKTVGIITVTSGIIVDSTQNYRTYIGAYLKKFKIWVEKKNGTVTKLHSKDTT